MQPEQSIPSTQDASTVAPKKSTDLGNIEQNELNKPSQGNIDFSIRRRFLLSESKNFQLRADFFNLLNHANRNNPVSDISTADFGQIVSFSSSSRIVQLSVEFNF